MLQISSDHMLHYFLWVKCSHLPVSLILPLFGSASVSHWCYYFFILYSNSLHLTGSSLLFHFLLFFLFSDMILLCTSALLFLHLLLYLLHNHMPVHSLPPHVCSCMYFIVMLPVTVIVTVIFMSKWRAISSENWPTHILQSNFQASFWETEMNFIDTDCWILLGICFPLYSVGDF